MREVLTYGWRWFKTTANGALPCRVRKCGKPTVGLSLYCQEHTDQIRGRR